MGVLDDAAAEVEAERRKPASTVAKGSLLDAAADEVAAERAGPSKPGALSAIASAITAPGRAVADLLFPRNPQQRTIVDRVTGGPAAAPPAPPAPVAEETTPEPAPVAPPAPAPEPRAPSLEVTGPRTAIGAQSAEIARTEPSSIAPQVPSQQDVRARVPGVAVPGITQKDETLGMLPGPKIPGSVRTTSLPVLGLEIPPDNAPPPANLRPTPENVTPGMVRGMVTPQTPAQAIEQRANQPEPSVSAAPPDEQGMLERLFQGLRQRTTGAPLLSAGPRPPGAQESQRELPPIPPTADPRYLKALTREVLAELYPDRPMGLAARDVRTDEVEMARVDRRLRERFWGAPTGRGRAEAATVPPASPVPSGEVPAEADQAQRTMARRQAKDQLAALVARGEDPRPFIDRMMRMPGLFAASAADEASAGLMGAVGRALGFDTPTPETTGEGIAAGAGTLVGFVAGLPLKVGRVIVEKTVGQWLAPKAVDTTGKLIAKAIAHESALLGTASAVAHAGKAAEQPDVAGAAREIGGAAKSGAVLGATFGAASMIAPGAGAMATAARIGLGTAMIDATQGTRPWDDRELTQKAFDYGLNAYFLLNAPGVRAAFERPASARTAEQQATVDGVTPEVLEAMVRDARGRVNDAIWERSVRVYQARGLSREEAERAAALAINAQVGSARSEPGAPAEPPAAPSAEPAPPAEPLRTTRPPVAPNATRPTTPEPPMDEAAVRARLGMEPRDATELGFVTAATDGSYQLTPEGQIIARGPAKPTVSAKGPASPTPPTEPTPEPPRRIPSALPGGTEDLFDAVPSVTPASGPPPKPTAEPPPTKAPQWVLDDIEQHNALAERLGIADRIEELSAQRKTAKEVAAEIAPVVNEWAKDTDPKLLVRAVRSKRGIPSMDDATAFEAWLRDRFPAPQPEQKNAAPEQKNVAPEAPPATAPTPRPASDFTLPRDLAGARPRYRIGPNEYLPQFESDLDKAFFITAQAVPSPRDADYKAAIRGAIPDISDGAIKTIGAQVREHIKNTVRGQEPGEVTIPAFTPTLLRDRMGGAPTRAEAPTVTGTEGGPATTKPVKPRPATAAGIPDNFNPRNIDHLIRYVRAKGGLRPSPTGDLAGEYAEVPFIFKSRRGLTPGEMAEYASSDSGIEIKDWELLRLLRDYKRHRPEQAQRDQALERNPYEDEYDDLRRWAAEKVDAHGDYESARAAIDQATDSSTTPGGRELTPDEQRDAFTTFRAEDLQPQTSTGAGAAPAKPQAPKPSPSAPTPETTNEIPERPVTPPSGWSFAETERVNDGQRHVYTQDFGPYQAVGYDRMPKDPRSGWELLGKRSGESAADHASYGTLAEAAAAADSKRDAMLKKGEAPPAWWGTAPETAPAAPPPATYAHADRLSALTDRFTALARTNTLPTDPRELRKIAAETLGVDERTLRDDPAALDDLFDGLEAAVNQVYREKRDDLAPVDEQLARAQATEAWLGNRTKTIEVRQRQQFSTPLPIAELVSFAADPGRGDHVYEPTAGTGNLLAAMPHDADIVSTEKDPRRAATLQHQGYHVDVGDALTSPLRGDVVIMNPPWGKYSTNKYGRPIAHGFTPVDIAERFVANEVRKMANGGRLVAVLPTTVLQSGQFTRWLGEQGAVRALLRMPPNAYDTRGTTVDSLILVFDKGGEARGFTGTIRGQSVSFEDAARALAPLGGDGELARGGYTARLEERHQPVPEGEQPERAPVGEPEPVRLPERPATEPGSRLEPQSTSPGEQGGERGREPTDAAVEQRPAVEPSQLTLGEPARAEAQPADAGSGRPERGATPGTEGPGGAPEPGSGHAGPAVVATPDGGTQPYPGGEGERLRGEPGGGVPDAAPVKLPARLRNEHFSVADHRELEAAASSRIFAPAPLRAAPGDNPHPRLIVFTRSLAGARRPAIVYEPQGRLLADAYARKVISDQQLDYGILPALHVNERGRGYLAAADVGVGKTRIGAAVAAEWIESGEAKRLLYVTASEVNVQDVMREFNVYAGGEFPAEFIQVRSFADAKERPSKDTFTPLPTSDRPTVYLIDRYNLAAYRRALSEVEPDAIIGDEAHLYKNIDDAAVGKAWLNLQTEALGRGAKFLYLTATPATDFGDLAHFIGLKEWTPDGFGDYINRVTGNDARARGSETELATEYVRMRGLVERALADKPDELRALLDQIGDPATAEPTARVDAYRDAITRLRVAALKAGGEAADTAALTGGDAGEIGVTAGGGKKKSSFMRGSNAFGVSITPGEQEQLMREFVIKGIYDSVDLWRAGVEFDIATHPLEPEQLREYRQLVAFFRDLNDAFTKFGRYNTQKKFYTIRHFLQGEAKRRMFDYRLPEAIECAKASLARGEQPVISTISVREGKEDTGLIPAAINSINARHLEINDDGGVEIDEEIPEALVRRAELLDRWKAFRQVPSPVDVILAALGKDNVAVVTGDVTPKNREKMIAEFQAGARKAALISGAGKTGISLHHVIDGPGEAKGRRHLIVTDYEWSATQFKQELGRVDRSGQLSAPKVTVLSTGAAGERKFLGTIANRMRNLGALSKGSAESASHGQLAEFEIGGDLDTHAMRNAYRDLPDDIKDAFLASAWREYHGLDPQTKEPIFRNTRGYPDKASLKDFLLDLQFMTPEDADVAFNKFWAERQRLVAEQEGDDLAGGRTSSQVGQIVRSTELSPNLVIHEVRDKGGHKCGILQGLVTDQMDVISPFLETSKVGGTRRRYVTFAAGDDQVAGLEIRLGAIQPLARRFGQVLGGAIETPEQAAEALNAGDRIPTGGGYTLRKRQDGKIAIDGAKMADRDTLLKNGAAYSPVGNFFFVKDLGGFLARFPLDKAKMRGGAATETEAAAPEAPTPPLAATPKTISLDTIGPAMRHAEIRSRKDGLTLTFRGESWTYDAKRQAYYNEKGEGLGVEPLNSHFRDLAERAERQIPPDDVDMARHVPLDAQPERQADNAGTVFPIKEPQTARMMREQRGYKEIVRVDAAKLRDLFESQSGETLPFKTERLASVRAREVHKSHPEIDVTAGQVHVNDGRHRLAVAAERGQQVDVAVKSPEAAGELRELLRGPIPAAPIPAAPIPNEPIPGEVSTPRIERTPLGDQTLIPGTPTRALPDAALKPTRAQRSVDETPLFGQVRDETRRAQDEAQGTLFARAERPEDLPEHGPAPVFYSGLQRAIEAKMPERAFPQQVQQILRGPGVKADEVKWTGLDDFLKAQGDRKVTKAEVLDYLRANAVDVEEKVLGGKAGNSDQIAAALRSYENAERALTPMIGRVETAVREALERTRPDLGARGIRQMTTDIARDLRIAATTPDNMGIESARRILGAEHAAAQEAAAQIARTRALYTAYTTEQSNGRGAEARYRQYTLPGGENYREVLLTLPVRGDEAAPTGPRGWSDINNPARAEGEGVFRSPHFNEPNIVAHGRVTDRVDAEGKPGLLAEEIQSDWHEAGREKGYKRGLTQENYATWAARRGMTADEIRSTFQTSDARFQEWRVTSRDALLDASAVPPAPFEKTWPELVFKRLVCMAAEEGKEWFGWTTGEQQAERYNLRTHVDKIQALHRTDGRFDLMVFSKGEIGYRDITGLDERALGDTVGKDLAVKIASQPSQAGPESGWRTYHDLDLEVGGEGMKGFYDKILVDFARKFAKKWGATVEKREIDVGPREDADYDVSYNRGVWQVRDRDDLGGQPIGEFQTREEAERYADENFTRGATVWSIPITPDMRRSAVEEGQPLFARRGRGRAERPPAEYRAAIEAGPEIPGTPFRIADTSRDPADRAELDRLAAQPVYQRLAQAIGDAFTVLRQSAGAFAPRFRDIDLAALSVDDEYTAAYIPNPGQRPLAAVNPWVHVEAAEDYTARGVIAPTDRPLYVASQIVASVLHEFGHRHVGGHDERFSGLLTRTFGRAIFDLDATIHARDVIARVLEDHDGAGYQQLLDDRTATLLAATRRSAAPRQRDERPHGGPVGGEGGPALSAAGGPRPEDALRLRPGSGETPGPEATDLRPSGSPPGSERPDESGLQPPAAAGEGPAGRHRPLDDATAGTSDAFNERGAIGGGRRPPPPEAPPGTPLADIDAMARPPRVRSVGELLRRGKDRAIETQVNQFEPLRQLSRLMEMAGTPPEPGEAPIEVAELASNRARGQALVFARRLGRIYKRVHDRGLENALNQYLTLKQFAKRIRDLQDRGLREGETIVDADGRRPDGSFVNPRQFDLDKIDEGLNQLIDQLGPDDYARVEQASQDVWALNRDILDRAREAGLVSQSLYEALTSRGEDYVPMHVLDYISEVGEARTAPKPFDVRYQNVVRRMEGTERDVRNVLESSMEKAVRALSQINRNRAARAVTDLQAIMPTVITRIPNDRFVVPGDKVVVSAFVDGKRENYAVPPDIARAMKFLDAEQIGAIGAILRVPKQILQAGATGANIAFAVTNLQRDLKRSAVYSKYGTRASEHLLQFGLDWLRALGHVYAGAIQGKPDALYEDFLESGAAFSTLQRNISAGEMIRDAAGVGGETVSRSGLLRIARALAHFPRAFNNVVEETTKVQTYLRGQRSGDSPEAVAYETANYGGSPNFSRTGSWGQAANLAFMFYNARLQGTAADVRRLASDPGTRLRVALYMLAPAMALWAYNQLFKDDHGLEDLNPAEGQRFYRILLPFTYQHSDGSTRRAYIKIAKEETEQVLATIIEQGLDHLTLRHPASVEKMVGDFLGNLSPIPWDVKGSGPKAWAGSIGAGVIASGNPVGRIPVELLSNESYFMRRPIVSKSEERRKPEDQYGPATAPLMIALGRATGLSPKKLQYAITSGTGGVGQTALDASSKVLAEPRPDVRGDYEKAARLPIASRFLGTGGNYQVQEIKERFYEQLDQAHRTAESIKLAQRSGDVARVRELRTEAAFANKTYLDNAARDLAELRNQQRLVAESPRLTPEGRTRRLAALAKQEAVILQGFEKVEGRRSAAPAGR